MAEQDHTFGSDCTDITFIKGDRRVRRQVRGLQIGRFFVRSRIAEEFGFMRINGVPTTGRDWFVTHINTGVSWTFMYLSTALFVADEISRHARVDPNTTVRDDGYKKIRSQLGDKLWLWLESLPEDQETVPSFKQWCAVEEERLRDD